MLSLLIALAGAVPWGRRGSPHPAARGRRAFVDLGGIVVPVLRDTGNLDTDGAVHDRRRSRRGVRQHRPLGLLFAARCEAASSKHLPRS